MPITRFIDPVDPRTVAANVCVVLKFMAGVFAVPLLVSLGFREFTYSALFGGIAAGALLVSRLRRKLGYRPLELKEALVIVALAYLLFALIGGMAFLPEFSYLDGIFESMSGFTTTGLTIVDGKHLPRSLVFFRSYSQWIGGAGIASLGLALLLGPGASSMRIVSTEGARPNLAGNVVATARQVAKIYGALTVAGFLLFLAVGMEPFAAWVNIMATVSTGGFSSAGAATNTLPAQVSVLFFMFLGATGFRSYYLAATEGPKRFFHDRQVFYLVGLPLFFTGILMLAPEGDYKGFFSTLFNLSSALTTTGFSLSQVQRWGSAARITAFFLMIIGGASGSTAGGIKIARFIIILHLARWVVLRPLLPAEAKLSLKSQSEAVSDRELRFVFGFVVLHFGLIFISSLVLVFYGLDFFTAAFESASALGTVGLTSVTAARLAAGAKAVLIVDMWAGRIEIMPVLVLAYMTYKTTAKVWP